MALLSSVIQRGVRGSQPAASSVGAGTLYCVTDEGDIVERSSGSAWEAYSPAATGGTVTHTGTLTANRIIKGNGTADITVGDLTGDVTTSGTMATTAKTALKTGAIGIVIDGGGSVITTGIKGDVYCPYAATITAVTMLADQSGSIVVDIWKDVFANYPPTVADTIINTGAGGTKPTITTATNSQDTTLAHWTTSISAGDTIRFNVDSVTSITRLTLALTVTK